MVRSARIDRSGGQSEPPEINRHTRLPAADTPLKVPPIEDVLIAYLNHTFPDQLSLVDRLGSLQAAQGARAVIAHLIELHTQQNNKDH